MPIHYRLLLRILGHASYLKTYITYLNTMSGLPGLYLNTLNRHDSSRQPIRIEHPRTLSSRQPIRIEYYVTRVISETESGITSPESNITSAESSRLWVTALLGSRIESARYSLPYCMRVFTLIVGARPQQYQQWAPQEPRWIVTNVPEHDSQSYRLQIYFSGETESECYSSHFSEGDKQNASSYRPASFPSAVSKSLQELNFDKKSPVRAVAEVA